MNISMLRSMNVLKDSLKVGQLGFLDIFVSGFSCAVCWSFLLAQPSKSRVGSISASADIRGGQTVDAISIRERPAEAEERAIPGHWEGCRGLRGGYIP